MTPDNLVPTRLALHRLATYVIAPVRHVETGRFGLRAAPRGFGTPPFGDNHRKIWVQGSHLFDRTGEEEARSVAITSLAAAASFLNSYIDPETAAEHDSPALGDVDTHLDIGENAALFLGDWFEMAFAALNDVRADEASAHASEPQLWPGHFDPAIEIGDEDHRASYGASPGDASCDEPYVYVSIWWPDRVGASAEDPFWNATAFTGSILRWSEFSEEESPTTVAARFWRTSRDHLHT